MYQEEQKLDPTDTLQGVVVFRNLIEQLTMKPAEYRLLESYLNHIELDLNELIVSRSIIDRCGCNPHKKDEKELQQTEA